MTLVGFWWVLPINAVNSHIDNKFIFDCPLVLLIDLCACGGVFVSLAWVKGVSLAHTL